MFRIRHHHHHHYHLHLSRPLVILQLLEDHGSEPPRQHGAGFRNAFSSFCKPFSELSRLVFQFRTVVGHNFCSQSSQFVKLSKDKSEFGVSFHLALDASVLQIEETNMIVERSDVVQVDSLRIRPGSPLVSADCLSSCVSPSRHDVDPPELSLELSVGLGEVV